MKHSTKTIKGNSFVIALLVSVFMVFSFTAKAQTTVYDVIAGSPDHETLKTAIDAAGLDGALQGDGPFTVFAPIDAAFTDLPADVVEALLEDPSGELTNILLYHVVGAAAESGDLTDGQSIETLLGLNVEVTIGGNGSGDVFINGVQVTVADITADNGVVHVIDAVLLPPYELTTAETTEFGTIFTDGDGNTLYFFTRDADGTSACAGACIDNWPVFYAENAVFPASLNEEYFGEIDRGEGVMQTTYKGWPLYYFINDNDAGDINGDGVNNIWFVAKPDYTIMLTNNQLTGLDGINYTGEYEPGDEVIQYLVDASGFTLYTWINDFNNRNMFTAEDFANNAVWPIYEETEFVLPSNLNADDFAVIDVHGTSQMTYRGWPLYFFNQDTERGENKGVSVPAPGVWPVAVPDMDEAPEYTTVVDLIAGSAVHTTLAGAVTDAGLVETLQGDGPFTVFAPTNDAFAALPAGFLDDLSVEELTNILLYHVAAGTTLAGDLSDGMTITTVQGQRATITFSNGDVFINEAQITVADLEADNGVVHVIDAVITPGPATVVDIIVDSDVHTTLAAAVTDAGLVETLQGEGPFTVFAPTNAAFDALPEGFLDDLTTEELTNILVYHVAASKTFSDDLSDGMTITTVQGQRATITFSNGDVFINDAQITVADLEADNGVVHVIDAVITPGPATVVDIITGSDVHTTLAAAVAAAELVEALQGEGPFTVFAPTNAAFEALPEGLVDELLDDPSGDLTSILLYHVVNALAFSTDLSDGDEITTMFGQDITVTINDDGVFINDAQVTVADLEADNGVVHVIDAVLIPDLRPETVVDIITASDVHTTLAAAVAAAELVEALQGEGPFTVFAPTNDAFAALPEGLLDDLLDDPTGELANILLYHVVAGLAMSSDLSDGDVFETLLGEDILVTINSEGEVFINNAQVTVADLEAQNGVVHVVNSVITTLSPTQTVVEIIQASEDHTTLATAIEAAELVDALSGEGPFTVFAPTNAAFEALPDGMLDDLLADPTGELANVLLYHVVAGLAMSSDLSDGDVFETLLGEDILVTINSEGEIFINNAQVTVADLEATNGVVHVVNSVITTLSPTQTVVEIIQSSEDHTTLATAIEAAELVDALSGEGPFTVFAPTNDAFAALPAGLLDDLLADPTGDLANILLYHVVNAVAFSTDLSDGDVFTTMLGEDITVTITDGDVFINQAQVIVADLEAVNGVVHVIDAVLVPDVDEEPTTVVDIIVGSEVHTTLAAAVTAAGLVETLQGEGPFTVFAPTDDAFAALPEGLLDDLLDDPTGALTDILLYHVVGAAALSTDLEDGQEITTLLGEDVVVTITNGSVFINDAQVIIADLVADNGVVHVIDAVLVPVTEDPEPVVVGFPFFEDFEDPATYSNWMIIDGSGSGFVWNIDDNDNFTVSDPMGGSFANIDSDAAGSGNYVWSILQAPIIDLSDFEGGAIELSFAHHYRQIGAQEAYVRISADGENWETIATYNSNQGFSTGFSGPFVVDAVTESLIIEGFETGDMLYIRFEFDDNESWGWYWLIDNISVDVYTEDPTPATVVDIIVGSEVHTTLAAAVTAAGLVETLQGEGPFTVFAPTDDAFAALPDGLLDDLLDDPTGALTDILLYHVVGAFALSTDLEDGQEITTLLGEDVVVTITNGSVFINDAEVIIADLVAENGVVHVIDAVLVPAAEPTTVVDIIVGSEVHTTLAAAVTAAGLVETLQGEGPFTVFAPTDDAFAALPDGLLDDLLADPTGDLTDILLYHVVGAFALSTDLSDGQQITTILGEDVTVTITNGSVFINDAQVIIADLVADNGVVHVIDAVLVPVGTNVDDFTVFDGINIFPNPARNMVTIEANLNSASNVTLEVFNIVGSQVIRYDLGSRSDLVRESLDVSFLPQGSYIITLRTSSDVITRKINIVR